MVKRKQKTLTISEYELPVVVEEDKTGGFVARCSKWSDCYAQGDTVEETLNEISYTASSLIELYLEEDMKIPLVLKKKKKQTSKDFHLKFPLFVAGNYA